MDSAKRTKHSGAYPPQEWLQSSRPRQPYVYHEVTILRHEPRPEWAPETTRAPAQYILDPIHPELLALVPGDPSSIVDFVERLGLGELLAWVFQKRRGALTAAWEPVVIPTAGHPSAVLIPQFVEYDALVDAWADPATVEAFTDEQELLRRGTAKKSPLSVVFDRWRSDEDSFPIAIMVDAMGIIYEKPKHIFARAWYEILDRSHATRVCGYCHAPFKPTRTDQIYCPGRRCGDRAFRQKYDRTPYRKEYQRMHKRWKRGTITDADWNKWKKEHQPKEAKR